MREGQFKRALDVLSSLAPLFQEADRFYPAANIVRAAGGVPDRPRFDQAWDEAEGLLEGMPRLAPLGWAMLSMARGATGVGEWERARTMAEHALAVATETREGTLVFAAESVLAFAQSRRAVETNANRNANEPVEQEADRLASEMVTSFRALATV
jgi:hypothetical protein